jgi:acetyl/propionyl-CoA carboxylase alpha subunit
VKLRVSLNDEPLTLDLEPNGSVTHFTVHSRSERSGHASIQELSPDVFSVLIGNRSFLCHITRHSDGLEVWTGLNRYTISLADMRDRLGGVDRAAAGPLELHAHMPGKVIALLVEPGAKVVKGQGLVVVEAMKMQNEVKSPKDGAVARICVSEGSTVAAGETLLIVE